MPFWTIASAVSRTTLSETRRANLFQLFQPMGGVLARPFEGTSAADGKEIFGSGAGMGPGGSVETCLNEVLRTPRPPNPGMCKVSPSFSNVPRIVGLPLFAIVIAYDAERNIVAVDFAV